VESTHKSPSVGETGAEAEYGINFSYSVAAVIVDSFESICV